LWSRGRKLGSAATALALWRVHSRTLRRTRRHLMALVRPLHRVYLGCVFAQLRARTTGHAARVRRVYGLWVHALCATFARYEFRRLREAATRAFYRWQHHCTAERHAEATGRLVAQCRELALCGLWRWQLHRRPLSQAFHRWTHVQAMHSKQLFLVEGAYHHQIREHTTYKCLQQHFRAWQQSPRAQRAMVLRTAGPHGNGLASVLDRTLAFSHYYLSALYVHAAASTSVPACVCLCPCAAQSVPLPLTLQYAQLL
jgi:hypothetical protein